MYVPAVERTLMLIRMKTEFHLLEHRKAFLEYLQAYQLHPKTLLTPLGLRSFCDPWDDEAELGYRYDDTSISDDMVSEVYLEFSNSTWRAESNEYLRTLTGAMPSCHTTRYLK